MPKHLIIISKPTKVIPEHPDYQVMTAVDYITNQSGLDLRRAKRYRIINLCTNYDYMSRGYYCSLLADARGQRSIPAAADIIALTWRRLYQSSLPELNSLLEKTYKAPLEDQVVKTYLIFFGRSETPQLQALARRIFDIFRIPIIALELRYEDRWTINKIEAWSLEAIPQAKLPVFISALQQITGAAWSKGKDVSRKERYWLAILHDPAEKLPPSNKAALEKFIRVGREMNIFVELITKNDISTLLEFDALFLRETTSIDHHSYRFAHKAEQEGIPCIDDTLSIMRCSNKVYLYELLSANKIPTPPTVILDKRQAKLSEAPFAFPFVLKIPDGSFSRGISKVHSLKDYHEALGSLFSKSDIILAQAFLPSEFDWRIGVLDGKPLFACQYFMVENHWQVYSHEKGGKIKEGRFRTLPVEEAPPDVIATALKAAGLIGRGLYGVDLKETKDGVFVIEINDNPNIDAGIEDKVLGDALYRLIIQHFIKLIEEA